jgi:Sodium:solute symporter family
VSAAPEPRGDRCGRSPLLHSIISGTCKPQFRRNEDSACFAFTVAFTVRNRGLCQLFVGFVLGTSWRRAGVLTDAEFTMIRCAVPGATAVRVLKAVHYGTVINCAVMAFVLVAASRIFEVFLPWHEWLPAGPYEALRERVAAAGVELHSGLTELDPATATTNSLLGIAATVAFVGLFSTTGGLRSVVRTDILQLALMLAGTLAHAVFAVDAVGGLGKLGARLETLYGADEAARLTSLAPSAEALAPFLTVLARQWIFQMNADGTGYLAQRTMACASPASAGTMSVSRAAAARRWETAVYDRAVQSAASALPESARSTAGLAAERKQSQQEPSGIETARIQTTTSLSCALGAPLHQPSNGGFSHDDSRRHADR